MRERKVGADDILARGNFCGAAMESQSRPAARLTYNFNFKPTDAVADPGAERFGCGLLGGKACGEALSGVALAQAIGLFGRKVDAVEKAPAVAIHRVLNAGNLCQIDSGTGNHVIFHATTCACRFVPLQPRLKHRVRPEAVCNARIQLPKHAARALKLQRLCQRRSSGVRLRDTFDVASAVSDKGTVRSTNQNQESIQPDTIPWAMQMKAVSTDEPSRLVQSLTGAILDCGGWVLSRGANDTGAINMLFEFERQACVEIYSVLIAAGLELSPNGHMRFTELCQCTRSQQRNCGGEIASVDLEVQTYPAEIVGTVPCTGQM